MDAVSGYYASFAQGEQARLARPAGIVEFTITTRFLERYLPADGRVLDIGGGPGRYSKWLLERGYRVTLADLSEPLLDIARAYLPTIEDIVQADARDLSQWPDNSFDSALCMGPMYHLTEPNDRQQALKELARVVQPGGIVFVALMPWLVFVRRSIIAAEERRHLADPRFLAALSDRGEFRNDIPGRFTHAFGARPADIAPFFERHGFTTITLASTHGFANGIEEQFLEMQDSNPDAYQAALDLLVNTADDPSILGLAGHLLYIGTLDRPI